MGRIKGRVLVCDDSRSIRAALVEHLEGRGYGVLAVASGEEALQALENEAFDVVVLDVVMPGMDGLAVLARIREGRSKLELPVLMATARSDSSDVVRALELGANDYVTKPIDLAVACARIESQLSVRRAATSLAERRTMLAADGSVPVGTVLDGRYELLRVLGAGGFAVVYEARQASTGQVVAVKLLRAHRAAIPGSADVELARFRREMALIGELRHPHIVRLIDSGWLEVQSSPARVAPAPRPRSETATTGQTGATVAIKATPKRDAHRAAETMSKVRSSAAPGGMGDEVETRVPFIVMEFLEGETLYELLATRGRLPATEAVDLLLPVMSGLWAAHARGAVHRDLKPGNIFLARSDDGALRPTVLDFGVAKLVSDEGSELTETESMIGTPGYWSPEQARGNRDLDARSDQYTLGAILYQCVAGRKPFEGGGMKLVHAIARGDFPPPSEVAPDLPPGLEELILQAMANDPAERFPTVRALARGLLPHASPTARARWAGTFEPGGTMPPPAR